MATTHNGETYAELRQRLAEAAKQVTVGARYMHYKQQFYKVVALALREEDNEPCVMYEPEFGNRILFVRPVSSWVEEVEVSGKKVKRFTKVEEK